MIDRRETLKLLAVGVLTPQFLRWEPEALIAGLRGQLVRQRAAGTAPPAGPYRFEVLDAHQRAMVAEIAEMIIPATDTPGARAAQVDEFIDLILADWASDAERATFLAGLADLDASSARAYGTGFLEATPEQRAALLTELDAALTAARRRRKAWKEADGPKPPDHTKTFWHQMRSLTVSGYYGSEIGFTVERHDVIIPGIYKSCTPIEDGAR